jgi:SSS family solute:Na+ symporter
MPEGFKGHPYDYVVILAYFIAVVGFGLWFGRYTKSTKDFFFGGQRFAWWLIAFSATATTVGSYSFIKYSGAGFTYGLSSTQSYLNDWFWVPIVVMVWVPIIYFARIRSVPEYFERRFGTASRNAATVLILLYLIGYVGINLFTLGRTMEALLGWDLMWGAGITALIVMAYMFAGGQTSVIMTDLAQGIILLIAGIGLFLVGVYHFGGFGDFWALLPKGHKYAFSEVAAPDKFSFFGIWAQDGLANTGAFVLMNQGIIMRFLSLKSAKDAQKMAVAWLLILAPLAALAVSGGGWIARALVENGEIAVAAGETYKSENAFVDAAVLLLAPGVFGFVLAALTAALMSTADTLVTAVSAIFLNDVYRPYLRPGRSDKHYLRVARVTSVTTVLLGLILVPVFEKSKTIYGAHGMFTAAVTPPIVVALLYGMLWKRYTPAAALATMVGGGALVGVSFVWPDPLLKPLALGMGPDSYKFIRAFYGLLVCGALGFIVTWLSRPKPAAELVGLVTGTQLDGMRLYKGGDINRTPGEKVRLRLVVDDALPNAESAIVNADALGPLSANTGDLLYANEPRWWFGGLRSAHVRLTDTCSEPVIRLHPDAVTNAHFTDGQDVVVEKLL